MIYLDKTLEKKIEELQMAIDYKLKFAYKDQEERDLYRRLDQLLDIFKRYIEIKND